MSDVSAPEAAAGTADTETVAPAAPVLRVVNPDATPEEIAALVAIFSAMGGGEVPAPAPRSEWSNPDRLARRTLQRHLPHGRGGWRSSGLPH